MANLTFIEKEYFEELFEMGSGYVLDFSNRKFQAFIHDKIKIDVYDKYPELSKAKILRQIIAEYDNVTVGKLLLELQGYMQVKKLIQEQDREVFEKCAEIGKRLIGKTNDIKTKVTTTTTKPSSDIFDWHKYIKALQELTNYADTPQLRGFAFEKFLNELFKMNDLEPRGSFRIIGEQIDGSFILHNEIYLLEAKWTKEKISKGDLVIFNEKVSSKSGFTRGLYISYAGYSDEALATFANGRRVNVILMTVQELAVSFSRQINLTSLLWSKTRALAEEGNFNKSIFEI